VTGEKTGYETALLMKDFRIALAQCRPSIEGDPDANLELMEANIEQALAMGADLIAFPEVTLSGYVVDPDEVRGRAFEIGAPAVEKAVKLSETFSTHVCFGMFEKSGGDCFNTYMLAGNGELIGLYRKVHIPPREEGLFTPGFEFKVFTLPFAKVGLSICYDNEFPESHMCLVLKGAEVIIMPAGWAEHWEKQDYVESCSNDDEVVAERRRWMQMMFGARCRDTGTYSALVNHSGIEAHGPWRFVGKSAVFAPTGKIIAEARAWGDELLVADLGAQLLEDYRNMDAYVLKARNPQAYRPLVEVGPGKI
jgi:predicted amidohydrolase